MESLLERLDGWLTTSDRYCVVSLYRYSTLFSNCISLLLSLLLFSMVNWSVFFLLLFCFVFLPSKGQSGTVIATVLPTLAVRHNSTLTIIPNSGCLRGLCSSRHSLTCYEGIDTNISSCVVCTFTMRNYIHYAPSTMINDDSSYTVSLFFLYFFFWEDFTKIFSSSMCNIVFCCVQHTHMVKSFALYIIEHVWWKGVCVWINKRRE